MADLLYGVRGPDPRNTVVKAPSALDAVGMLLRDDDVIVVSHDDGQTWEADSREMTRLLIADARSEIKQIREELAERQRDYARLRAALEEIAHRTVQRDLSQLAKAALNDQQDGDGHGGT